MVLSLEWLSFKEDDIMTKHENESWFEFILLNILVGFLNYVLPILFLAFSAYFTDEGKYGLAVGCFGLFLNSLKNSKS